MPLYSLPGYGYSGYGFSDCAEDAPDPEPLPTQGGGTARWVSGQWVFVKPPPGSRFLPGDPVPEEWGLAPV